MYVVCVTSWVKPEFADRYMEACLENARNTRNEPGNLRFDVLRCKDPDNQFFFYEVYLTEDDFKAHQQTAHYFKWRDTATPWMEKPRVGVRHESLFPGGDASHWSAG